MTTPDPSTRLGHCTGCTDPRSEGTHQMGTIEHPEPEATEPLAYEDQLPEMTKDQYDAWYRKSKVVGGVRMGPPVEDPGLNVSSLQAPAEGDKAITDEQAHYLFMGWLHVNHGDVEACNENKSPGPTELCKRAFLDALRYAREHGFLAPVQNMVVVGMSEGDMRSACEAIMQNLDSTWSVVPVKETVDAFVMQALRYANSHLKPVSVADIKKCVQEWLAGQPLEDVMGMRSWTRATGYDNSNAGRDLVSSLEQLTKP